MAGALNGLYLVLAVGVAVLGLGGVLRYVVQPERDGAQLVEAVTVGVALLFVLGLGIQFLAA